VAQTESDGLEVLKLGNGSFAGLRPLPAAQPCGRLLQQLALHARTAGGRKTFPLRNHSLPEHHSSCTAATLPGSQEMERRIKSLVRWNALAMVVRGQ